MICKADKDCCWIKIVFLRTSSFAQSEGVREQQGIWIEKLCYVSGGGPYPRLAFTLNACAQWRVNICEHTTNELQQIYIIYIYSIENGRELNWRGEWLNASVHSKYIAHAYEYPSLSHFCIVICRNFIFFYSFPFCITHRATMSVPRTASLRKYIDNIDGNIKNIHWSIKTSPSYF